MLKCPECKSTFELDHTDERKVCMYCGADLVEADLVEIEEEELQPIDADSGRIWSHYPTLRVLKSVFWIAGILTGIGGSLILFQTGAWPVFISTTISAIVLMSVPEILLILIRIEAWLASIDGKLKDK